MANSGQLLIVASGTGARRITVLPRNYEQPWRVAAHRQGSRLQGHVKNTDLLPRVTGPDNDITREKTRRKIGCENFMRTATLCPLYHAAVGLDHDY